MAGLRKLLCKLCSRDSRYSEYVSGFHKPTFCMYQESKYASVSQGKNDQILRPKMPYLGIFGPES